MTDRELANTLYPSLEKPVYRMPDYAQVQREMQKSSVTLSLLWLEYCETCQTSGELAYKSTQFSKYYNDYLRATGATMHLNHKPGELLQVDWAGDTAGIMDTDTGEIIPAYLFVASLPYSGYAYVEAFLSMNQEAWICAHVNAFEYFGGVTRIIQCDNLKTGVVKNTRSEVVLNRSYQEMAAHYNTAIIPCRVRSPKDKGHVGGHRGHHLHMDHCRAAQPAVPFPARTERRHPGAPESVQRQAVPKERRQPGAVVRRGEALSGAVAGTPV